MGLTARLAAHLIQAAAGAHAAEDDETDEDDTDDHDDDNQEHWEVRIPHN